MFIMNVKRELIWLLKLLIAVDCCVVWIRFEFMGRLGVVLAQWDLKWEWKPTRTAQQHNPTYQNSKDSRR
jgi:hypothetical protein